MFVGSARTLVRRGYWQHAQAPCRTQVPPRCSLGNAAQTGWLMDLKVRFEAKAILLALPKRGRPRLKRFSVLSRVSRQRFTFCGCLCLLNRDCELLAWGEGLNSLFPPGR